MDYIFFFYGLAFIFLAASSWALSYKEDQRLPWKWLSLFGLVHGINEWLDLLVLSLRDTPSYAVLRLIVMIISFLFLVEFGRSGSNAIHKKRISLWIYIPLLLIAGLGAFAGISGLNSTARYALALPGSILACMTLWRFRRLVHPKSRSLLIVVFSMAIYGLATGIVTPKSSFFPASFLNYDSFFAFTGFPIQLLRGVLACALAAAFWQHYCSYRKTAFKTVISSKVFRNEVWMMATIVTVLIAGWFMTYSFGEYGRRQDGGHYGAELKLAQRMLEDSVQNVGELTKVLAASPDLIIRGHQSPRELSRMNLTLDRFARVIRGSICYALDVDGTTIASSNRGTTDSFVGHSYQVRPYFKEALKGRQGSYIAVGLTSMAPGYYSSYPIRNEEGRVAGVAVIKLNLNNLYIAPIGNNLGFLANSSGIILVSTRPGYFLKTLYPIAEDVRRSVAESAQFQGVIGAPVLSSYIGPETLFRLHGEIFQIFLQSTSVEGLSFVLLGPMSSWKMMRLLAIFITLVVAVLLIIFFVIQQRTSESSARIAASERLNRTLVDGSPNWVGLFDHEGKYISINGNGLKAMGRKKSEVLGRRFSEIWSKENQPMLEESVRQVLAGEQLTFEMDQTLPDGDSITWYVVLNPIYMQDGTISSFVGIATDISIRKQAEKVLMESEERFRMMFSRHNAVMLLVDPVSGNIVNANRSAELFYGYTNEQLRAMQIQDINSAHPEEIATECQRAMTGNQNVFVFPHRLANGSTRIVEVHSTPLSLQNKDLLFSIIHDITERKIAEEALKESEQRHREYIDNAPYGVFVTNEQGQYLQVNPAGCQITGYTEEELVKMSIPDLLQKETIEKDILHFQTLVHEGKSQCEIRFCPKSGERRWWSVTAVKISNNRFLEFCSDITDRKVAEEEKAKLEIVNRQLQKTESLSRMAGAIAHHFNNQLGAVIGNLEMAIDDLSADSETGEILTRAMKASRKAVEISSLMLTYLGQTPRKHFPLDLSEVCSQNLAFLQAGVPEGINFEVDLPIPGPTIYANANQIQQILTNLVTNAWEAIENSVGSIALAVKVVASADIPTTHLFPIDWQVQESYYACLEVKDEGRGVTDMDIEKLFDPFFSSKFTGRGLGLPIVQGIAKAHHGVVTVQSEIGRGSIFQVFFPLSETEVHQHSEKAIKPLMKKNGGTVLLIEGEEIIRNMAEAILTRLGFKVLMTVDGCEAVELFRQHMNKITVVLCDLTMSCIDGWNTVSALRRVNSTIPVVVTSGHDESKVIRSNDSNLPQHVFLQKPYQKAELRNALERAMTETIFCY